MFILMGALKREYMAPDDKLDEYWEQFKVTKSPIEVPTPPKQEVKLGPVFLDRLNKLRIARENIDMTVLAEALKHQHTVPDDKLDEYWKQFENNAQILQDPVNNKRDKLVSQYPSYPDEMIDTLLKQEEEEEKERQRLLLRTDEEILLEGQRDIDIDNYRKNKIYFDP